MRCCYCAPPLHQKQSASLGRAVQGQAPSQALRLQQRWALACRQLPPAAWASASAAAWWLARSLLRRLWAQPPRLQLRMRNTPGRHTESLRHNIKQKQTIRRWLCKFKKGFVIGGMRPRCGTGFWRRQRQNRLPRAIVARQLRGSFLASSMRLGVLQALQHARQIRRALRRSPRRRGLRLLRLLRDAPSAFSCTIFSACCRTAIRLNDCLLMQSHHAQHARGHAREIHQGRPSNGLGC